MISLRYVDRRLALLALLALALEGWVLLSDFHLFWKPPRVASGAVRVAKVLSVSRLAKARSSLQLNWFDLSAGQDLYEGDEVATMDQSDATLKFVDGQTVTLDPNSFLVLRSGTLGSDHAFQISLLRGGLQQAAGDVGADPSHSRLEIDVGGRKVVAQGKASVKIESTASGQPELAVGGSVVSVTEIGNRGIVIGRAPPLLSSSFEGNANSGGNRGGEARPPSIQSPASNSVLVNPSGILLGWKAQDASNAPTLVEVSTDEEFKDVLWHVILAGERETSFVPPHKGRYFWRVTRLSDKKLTSAVASFEVRRELRAPTLARPRIEKGQADQIHRVDAPVLGRPIIHYERWLKPLPARKQPSTVMRMAALLFDGFDRALESEAFAADADATRYQVDLSWGSVSEATAYVLQIATDELFEHVVAEKVLTQTSFVWHTDNAGFYYWRVSGVDKDGDRGPHSEFNTFAIKAERNKQGDEGTYESYLEFDEYTKYTQSLRVLWGPMFDRYYFSSDSAPYNVIYRSHSYADGQISYDYRLNPHYSLQASLRLERTQLDAPSFEGRPNQPTLAQLDTQISIGVLRRFFYPRHYFALMGGVRANFVNLPIDDGVFDDKLALGNDGYFGLYLGAGYYPLLGWGIDGAVTLGGAYQNSGDAFRATQFASLEVRRKILDFVRIGIRLDEFLVAYRLSTDPFAALNGQAHELTFRPSLFVDWSF